MKIALIHDYLNQYGGAERVLEELHALFPDAPIYTSMYAPARMPPAYRSWDIRTSFIQRLPFAQSHHQPFLLLYPLAFESFDLAAYDIVISNSSAWAKGILTSPRTLHICYCLTPMRFAWSYKDYVERERIPALPRFFLPLAMNYLRNWDVASANRVDRFIAISRVVQARIQKYYRRPSEIIYPPVNTDAYQPVAEPDDFYLVVSRLIPYKRIDLVVEAFRHLDRRLVIVGDGRDRAALRRRAGPNVEFRGRVPDAELKRLYATCRGFIFPGEEDFGIAPVEAQAAGRPVIAYAAGGALDTVLDGVTGVHFAEQTPEALIEAVRRFERLQFDPLTIRTNALRFDRAVFQTRIREFVAQAWEEHRAAQPRGERLPLPPTSAR
jgi:glycosyltransferase involved in cell wall biosynthesis